MKRTLTTLVLVVLTVLGTTGTAHAGSLERQTRRDAGIPARAVERVPEFDRFIRGTQFRPEGTHCYTARTVKRVRVQGRLVPKNRLLQYCTDKYIDERRPARTFVRYLRYAKANAAEIAEQRRLDLLREEALRKFVADCLAGGGKLVGPICVTVAKPVEP